MLRFFSLLLLILLVRIVLFYFFTPRETIIQKNPVKEITIFREVKDHIKATYGSVLPGKDAALLMGIVFGDKSLDSQENKKFIATGVLHVVAASGMNVSMLTSFVVSLLLPFLRRQHALIATAVIILFYVALADFQASIVRAAIMAIIAIGANVLGRQNTSIHALFLTAFAMIFWDPSILSSIGFILSFSATLGIIIFDPIFKRGIFKSSFFDDFRTTLAAQIATTPILLFFFGSYSPISILVNFLVLWTIPPLMILGMCAAVLSFIIPVFAVPFIYLCMPLLIYFFLVIDFFSKTSHAITLENPPLALIAGYYLIISAGILWVKRQE